MGFTRRDWPLMCCVCFEGLTPETCAIDTEGVKWDVCKGKCALASGLEEVVIMVWNHRVLQRLDDPGKSYEQINFYVVEVFYEDDGKIMGWTEREAVFGESVDDLRHTLTWMLEALNKPVLDEAALLAEMEAARDAREALNDS